MGGDSSTPDIQVSDDSTNYGLGLIDSREEPVGFVLTPRVSPQPSQQDLRGRADETRRQDEASEHVDEDDDDGKA